MRKLVDEEVKEGRWRKINEESRMVGDKEFRIGGKLKRGNKILRIEEGKGIENLGDGEREKRILNYNEDEERIDGDKEKKRKKENMNVGGEWKGKGYRVLGKRKERREKLRKKVGRKIGKEIFEKDWSIGEKNIEEIEDDSEDWRKRKEGKKGKKEEMEDEVKERKEDDIEWENGEDEINDKVGRVGGRCGKIINLKEGNER